MGSNFKATTVSATSQPRAVNLRTTLGYFVGVAITIAVINVMGCPDDQVYSDFSSSDSLPIGRG
jgi:uncharacterized membrane protein YgaE (UPF0421/DUF939 family)